MPSRQCRRRRTRGDSAGHRDRLFKAEIDHIGPILRDPAVSAGEHSAAVASVPTDYDRVDTV